jgi:cell division protein FtsI/penicillin-binding protein 2
MHDPRSLHARVGWFQYAAVAFLALLFVRAATLASREVSHGRRPNTSARATQGTAARATRSLPVTRGRIVTARGEVLAESVSGYAVSVVPQRVIGNERALRELIALARLDPASGPEFRRKLLAWDAMYPGRSLQIRRMFADELSAEARTAAARMRGVSLSPVTLRRYPEGAITAAAVGAMSEVTAEELRYDEGLAAGDRRGRTGIENTWEHALRRGATVLSSLDLGLQREAARLFGTRRGAALALDPSDGRVFVYLSTPALDPSLYERGLDHDQYESARSHPERSLVDRVLEGRDGSDRLWSSRRFPNPALVVRDPYVASPFQHAFVWSAIANGGTVYAQRLVEAMLQNGVRDVSRAGPVVLDRMDTITVADREQVLHALHAKVQPGGELAHLGFRGLDLGATEGRSNAQPNRALSTGVATPLSAPAVSAEEFDDEWFVGLAPALAPRIVVIVRVEEAEAHDASRIGVGIVRAWQHAQEVRP